jgi:hypothetical protein
VNFTPLPGVTYKIFGSISTLGDGYVPEPVCRPNHPNSATIYFDSYSGGEPNYPVGFASSTAACTTGTGGIAATVYYDGTFGDATVLYTNSYSNDLWENNDGWFFKDGYVFGLDGSTVNSYTACPSPTPTASPTPTTTPTPTPSTSPAPAAVDVYTWGDITPNADGSGYFYGALITTTTPYDPNPFIGSINVDTTVTWSIYVMDDLFSYNTTDVVMSSGTGCASFSIGGFNIGAYLSTWGQWNSPYPTSYGNQTYYMGPFNSGQNIGCL